MENSIIRLCSQRCIDHTSTDAWDAAAFQSTYAEYLLQSQFYNRDKQYPRFSALLKAVPAAVKLHFLVSAAITPLLQQLDGSLPWLQDNAGESYFRFKQYRFEVLESDVKQPALHRLAIWFYSEPMRWHAQTGNYLLVSAVNHEPGEEGFRTHLIGLPTGLSIYSFKPSI
jgi:hypothetical protein